MSMKIIGITGTLAAGKGTVVRYLVEKKGYVHYSVRAFLIEEIKRRKMSVDRDSMHEVANDLREKYGAAYIVEQLYVQAEKAWNDAVIESIHTAGEAEALRNHQHFLLLAVDADQKLRYERLVQRKSETDDVSFEKFQEQEALEISNTDPSKQNLASCIAMADFVVYNNGSLEELHQQLGERVREC